MKHKLFIIIVSGTVFVFTACRKDANDFVPDAGQQLDTAWVSSITPALQVSLLSEKLRDTLNTVIVNAIPAPVITGNGIQISLPASGLLAGGSVVTGSLKVDYVLVQKKGDFIRYNIPAVFNRLPLESGGVINVTISTNNQPVDLIINKRIKIQYVDPSPRQGMKLYYGVPLVTGNPDYLNWSLSSDSLNVIVLDTSYVFPLQKSYAIETSKTGWLQTGKVLEPAQLRTEVSTVLPDLFSNANTAVYMVFKNARSVVQLTGNPGLRRFSFPNIPVGQDVVFVTISKLGDTYYLGLKEDKTVTGMISLIKPEKSSLPAILAFLNNLQ